jgi:hypothetical protein
MGAAHPVKPHHPHSMNDQSAIPITSGSMVRRSRTIRFRR